MDEFDFAAFMAKAIMREAAERWRQCEGCPDTIGGQHTDADNEGRCLWCRKKITSKMSNLFTPMHGRKSEAILAYECFYDPDYGNSPHDKY